MSKLIRSSCKYCFPHSSFCKKKCFSILCLNVLTFSVVFKKSGNLFQIQGATYERLFCPWLVFCNSWLNLNKYVLLAVVFWPAGLNTSSIYKGLKLLKYLEVIEQIHCSNWLFMCSQFIFSSSVKPIWAPLFKFRQKQMHLFWSNNRRYWFLPAFLMSWRLSLHKKCQNHSSV